MIIDLEGVRRGDALLRAARRDIDATGRTPRPIPLEEITTMAKLTYDTYEAADLLGLSDQTVRRWCRDGEIEAARFGRHYRISRPALEAFWRERGGGELFPDNTEPCQGAVDHARIFIVAYACAMEARKAAGAAPTNIDGDSLLPVEPMKGDWEYLENTLGRVPTEEESEAFISAFAAAMEADDE